MVDRALLIADTINLLSRARMRLTTEAQLKADMATLFKQRGLAYTPEYSLDATSRPDFFLDGVTIEVKIKGNAKSIYKQCVRYCEFDEVKDLILVTNRSHGFPPEINGKPCYVVNVGRAWL